jgi:hypothetical protein
MNCADARRSKVRDESRTGESRVEQGSVLKVRRFQGVELERLLKIGWYGG